MNRTLILAVAVVALLAIESTARAQINTVVVRNREGAATSDFKFKVLPSPTAEDLATKATFSIVAGERDSNGGDLEVLNDGRLPGGEDDPRANFFFAAGSEGGRLLVDLGQPANVEAVNTYSWHTDTRGPQVYKLYAADGTADDFEAQPAADIDPTTVGWRQVADVDTRARRGRPGGQYAASIFRADGPLGRYRYLLIEASRTEEVDLFGNTFFSEIDVVGSASTEVADASDPDTGITIVEAGDGKYQVRIDTSDAPDLTRWAATELAPVVQEWYPKIVEMLPSEGYEAPARFGITFTEDYRGVAAAGGSRIRGSASWFRDNLAGEAKGAIVHEMVHIVQQYGRNRRAVPNATRPGWLVEGIADYIRWFLYEPESGGARITARNIDRARFDASYRITGNFLNWVSEKHGQEVVGGLNAALREGRFTNDEWTNATGATVEELAEQWKADLQKAIDAEQDDAANN
ncbi:MAG: basic secretory protein-like protein [Pirellulales bacterium]